MDFPQMFRGILKQVPDPSDGKKVFPRAIHSKLSVNELIYIQGSNREHNVWNERFKLR